MRAQLRLRVVQVERAYRSAPEDALHLVHQLSVAAILPEVEPGREEVAGIQRHAEPVRSTDLGEDRGEFLELRPQGRSLPGRVLEQETDAALGNLFEDGREALRDRPKAR